jgi:thioredoxin-related protein
MRYVVAGRLAVALGLILGGWLPARAEDDQEKKIWTVDFEAAKVAAAKEGKDLLMEFTGSDWCPPCIALHKNVLTAEVFQTTAPKHFVLVKLDSPRDKSKQTDKEIAQYKTLSALHKVVGVPTIILADATGKPYAKLVGYGGDKAEDYTQKLVTKVEVRKKRDEYLAQAKSASGTDKAKLLAQAIEGLDPELSLAYYRETVDEIIGLDGENKAGLKGKFEGLVQLVDLKKELETIQRSARGADASEAIKKVDQLIEDKKLAGESLQEALYAKGVLQFRSDRPASKKTLEAAIEAAPKSEKAAQIQGILARAFKDSEKKDGEKKDGETPKATPKTVTPKAKIVPKIKIVPKAAPAEKE